MASCSKSMSAKSLFHCLLITHFSLYGTSIPFMDRP